MHDASEKQNSVGEQPLATEPLNDAEGAEASAAGATLLLSKSNLPGNVELDTFLVLAEQLALKLAELHGREKVLESIQPKYISFHPETLVVVSLSCQTACVSTQANPGVAQRAQLDLDPAFMSPEQTGQTNRPVDSRTDLYSLGAVLYHLATGRPPFEETDPIELAYAHIARVPSSLLGHRAWISSPLARVIARLLSKEPDERYQSAYGLAHDLSLLRESSRRPSGMESVELFQHDIAITPHPPRRLHGCQSARRSLLTAFERVGHGATEVVLVTGPAGVGKTSLIHELLKPAILANGFFVCGQFEQYHQHQPLLAPIQCLRQLCEQLLSKSDSSIAYWRQRLLSGLGVDVAVLFEWVPELALLLGVQASPLPLPAIESQFRLRKVLVDWLRLMAAPEHPLVFVLEDLQWADSASLELMQAVQDESELPGMLLIGSYREPQGAVGPSVPGLLDPRRATTLTLGPLDPEEVQDLLADMLRTTSQAVKPLSEILYCTAAGNPHFTVECVLALHRDSLIKANIKNACWSWNLDEIRNQIVSTNVVVFLQERLSRLSSDVVDLLLAMAGLGMESTLDVLARVTGCMPGSLVDQALIALKEGILQTPASGLVQLGSPEAELHFCHPCMHEAVINLRDSAWWEELHLTFARRLEASGRSERPADLSRAANHYALAFARLDSDEERRVARELFGQAARQARSVGSFAHAERMLRLAIRTLPPQSWQSDPMALWDYCVELHLACYCQSDYVEADNLYEWMKECAPSPVALAASTCIQVMSLSNRTRYADAIQVAHEVLNQLGMVLPLQASAAALEGQTGRFYELLLSGRLELLDSAEAEPDEISSSSFSILNRLIPAAFFADPALACWMAVRTGCSWMEHGYLPSAIYPMSCVSLATILLRGDFSSGYRAATLALSIGEKRENGIETARARHVFSLFNSHWFEPLESALQLARQAHEGLRGGGEIEFACYTYFTTQAATLDLCSELSALQSESEAALGFATRTGNQHAIQSFLAYQQLIRSLQGLGLELGESCEGSFRQESHLEQIRGNPMAQIFFHICRALSACCYSDESSLVAHAERAAALRPYITGFYPDALVNVFHSLSLIVRLRRNPGRSDAQMQRQLMDNQAWLAARAADAPMNFAHLHDWIEAERLDLLEQEAESHRLFERAMQRAKSHQRPLHLALITHHAGLSLVRRHWDHMAQLLLAQACALYQQWGAIGVVSHLMGRFPFLVGHPLLSDVPRFLAGLEEQSLLRACQALASERSLPALMARLIEQLSRLTGATRVQVVMADERGQWFLHRVHDADGRADSLELKQAESNRLIPGTVVRLALNTHQVLLSDDAVLDSRFVGDPYWAQSELRFCSLLAVPVQSRGRVNAYVILENRLYRAAFTHQHEAWVSLICGQLASGVENSLVYKSLELKVAERTSELQRAHERLLDSERELAAKTERERLLQEMVFHDALTKLPNRLFVQQRLNELLSTTEPSQAGLAVVVLDIHQLRHVNDLYGRESGDRLLAQAAQRLRQQFGKAKIVARLGGDEFVVVLCMHEHNIAIAELTATCEQLLSLMAQPFDVDGVRIEVGSSLGVALYPRDGKDCESLVRNADIAGRVSRRVGAHQYAFFENGMTEKVIQNLEIRHELRRAVGEQSFALHYQPQIDLRTGEMVGVEALVRWKRHGRFVGPGGFIPVAEESGLILPIGHWVLEEACRQAVIWRQSFNTPIVMAVNLSAVQFKHPHLAADVLSVVADAGLDPAGLELELTESLLIEGESSVADALALWKAHGIKISIDDFGTGYSGLAYLKRFDVDKVKLDRSFVANILSSHVDHVIVQAILQMTHALGLQTTAEGVEDRDLADSLLRMGCDVAQGYFYARPMSASDLECWFWQSGSSDRATAPS